MKKKPDIRVCLDCNQVIEGRADKKFCDDQCRINYHNSLSQKTNSSLKKINSILKRNRKIIRDFIQSGYNEVLRSDLADMGFNFKYHTHQLKEGNKIVTVCYDFGFRFTKPSLVKLLSFAEISHGNSISTNKNEVSN